MEQPKDWRYFKNLPPPPQYLNVAIRSKERPKCREVIMKIMSEFKHKCSICKEGSRQMCDYPNILNDLAEGWYYDGDMKMWLTDSLRTQARKMLREKLIKEYKMKTKEKDIEGRLPLAKFLRINEKGGIKNE